ncbi:metallophosphoesterase [Nonomuraea sp. NPDC005692]|uniref:metallophosphoesterase n=1 Tax=Nonomuraea sp. NPDC005692 TaxID=3157168 RepID=UPI0033DD7F7D
MTDHRVLESIVATTDVHSSFDRSLPMLTHLHAVRDRALIVDCGDFFEGSGYYRLGGGYIERQALVLLYDVIAPGNHGWRHHLDPDIRSLTVCANTIDAGTGEPLFRPLHIAEISGRRVGVTAVLGEQAFLTIPLEDRSDHAVLPPVPALQALWHRYAEDVGDWILLSHSGFQSDLALAAACPFISVIFSGHCHSEQYGPVRVGDTIVVKGYELSAGYAEAAPDGQHWAARAQIFSEPTGVADPVARLGAQIHALSARLAMPRGTLAMPFRDTPLDRRELLTQIARQLRSHLQVEAVVLNETCLRPTPLGSVLLEGDLLTIEPHGNELVYATLPETRTWDALLGELALPLGPLVVARDPRIRQPRQTITTQYLADTFLGGHWRGPKLPLDQAVQAVLTGQGGDAR